MRTAFFRVIMQQGSGFQERLLTIEDGIDGLSRNVDKKFSLLAAK
jgi:hypothetical protein